jgi:hypothetical protein
VVAVCELLCLLRDKRGETKKKTSNSKIIKPNVILETKKEKERFFVFLR